MAPKQKADEIIANISEGALLEAMADVVLLGSAKSSAKRALGQLQCRDPSIEESDENLKIVLAAKAMSIASVTLAMFKALKDNTKAVDTSANRSKL